MATDRVTQRTAALVLAVLVALVTVAGIVAALADGGDDDADEPTTTLGTVSGRGEELLDRLHRGDGTAVHVVLSSAQADVEPTGQQVTVELWRTADGHLRQDLVLEAAGLRSETRSLQREDGSFFCQRATESDWTCQELPPAAPGEVATGGLVEAAASELQGADVRTSDEEVLGRPARCYEIEGVAGRSSLCLGADGTPLRLAVQGRELTATVVDDDVPDGVLDLPAEPSPAPVAASTTAD